MNMDEKAQILNELRDEFDRWENILAGLSEAQITAPDLSDGWSIKDVMAHLWAWQQRSIARMEAALDNTEPKFPKWPEEFDPEMEGQPHDLNAWIYEANKDKSWAQVYGNWRTGFLRFIELAEAIPQDDLLTPGRYAWLDGHPLSLVLTASCEHHEEHHGWLLDYLGS
jgi:hypothetical protein